MKQVRTDDRVGDLLEVMGAVTREHLADAVARQKAGDPRPLGALLIALGYVNPRDVELALMRQQARRGHLKHDEGIRVLDEAHESTKRVAESFDELASAASELGKGDTDED